MAEGCDGQRLDQSKASGELEVETSRIRPFWRGEIRLRANAQFGKPKNRVADTAALGRSKGSPRFRFVRQPSRLLKHAGRQPSSFKVGISSCFLHVQASRHLHVRYQQAPLSIVLHAIMGV